MMSDDEIIAVVQARKEGKLLQWKTTNEVPNLSWMNGAPYPFDFSSYIYRVAPEPPECMTEIWLQDEGSGIWKEIGWGIGVHFLVDTNPSKGKLPKVPEPRKICACCGKDMDDGHNHLPRKPREWWIHLNASGMHEVHETTENRSHCGHCILVREVIE